MGLKQKAEKKVGAGAGAEALVESLVGDMVERESKEGEKGRKLTPVMRDPSALGRLGGLANKGKRKLQSLLRKKHLPIWENAEPILERNIIEMLTHPDLKIRMDATKHFAEYIKAKKRELAADINNRVVIQLMYDGSGQTKEIVVVGEATVVGEGAGAEGKKTKVGTKQQASK